MKYISEFDIWCKKATKSIRYRPDRQAVYGELYQHIEDRYLDFLEQGMKPENAELEALKVMGEPKEIAPMLAAIHRPFWGYMYSLCKWGFFLFLLIMFYKFIPWLINLNIHSDHITYHTGYDYNIDVFNQRRAETDRYIYERTLYTEPKCNASSDGYTFTITRAALWQVKPRTTDLSTTLSSDKSWLYIEMEVTNPRPWAKPVNYDALSCFWAEDSLGNHYYSTNDYYYSDLPILHGNGCQTGLFTYTYTMFTWNYVSLEAEWIDLHYGRSGKDITLRVDLTGGDEHED